MTLRSLLTEPVSVLPALEDATPDRYGNHPKTWGTALPYRGRIEPYDSEEQTTDEDRQIADFRLFLPPDAIISGSDRVTDADGLLYEVIGPPRLHRTPLGPHHREALLRRVTG
jgi:hypothetical protein